MELYDRRSEVSLKNISNGNEVCLYVCVCVCLWEKSIERRVWCVTVFCVPFSDAGNNITENNNRMD